ncbi:MAG: DNA/RNA non-specific endonuclease [Planctomycetota bacterium]
MKRAVHFLLSVLVLVALAGCAQPAAMSASTESIRGGPEGISINAFMGVPRWTESSAEYQLLNNIGYDAGYSNARESPLWSAYQVWPYTDPLATGRKSWKTDTRTSARVSTSDYTHTGYDRGHVTPNHAVAARLGTEAQKETFLMSNVCPQVPEMNQQTWRYLEEVITNDWGKDETVGRFWVTAGPIYGPDPSTIGPKNIEVPDSFYCLVIGEIGEDLEVLAIIMDQTVSGDHQLREFVTTVDAVEAATGLDFYSELPDRVEREIESQPPSAYWNIDRELNARGSPG